MKRIAAILIVVFSSFNLWSSEARASGNLPMVTGSARINNGAAATNSPNVVLTLAATSNSGSPVTLVRIANANASNWDTVPSLPYTTSKNWTLFSGDGSKVIYARFGDSAGNWSTITSATITLDTVLPVVTLKINSGAVYATTANVTLNLTVTDSNMGTGAQMQFSNNGTTWSVAEAYAATKAWALLAGDGLKTVSVKVKDAAGNWSTVSSAQITLDATRPTGSMFINSSSSVYTTSSSVTLKSDITDYLSGVAQMRISNDNVTWSAWDYYDERYKGWPLAAGNGVKTVYIQVKDTAGNVAAFSDTIILDTIAPVGTISINNDGTGHTTNSTVTLKLSATDATSGVSKMSFSNDNISWSVMENYATTKSWSLLPGRGPRKVYVRFWDGAGKLSLPVSSTIYLDVTPVAAYDFSANFNDGSGAGNNGIAHNDVAFDLRSSENYSVQFDGIDSYIEVPHSATLNVSALTISYWVKPNYKNYAGKEYTIISKGTPASKEYYMAMFGQTPGFGIVPGIVDVPALSAPSNLIAQYGGTVGGQEIVYLTWADNSKNEEGFTIEVRDHNDVQVSLTDVAANTKSFRSSFAPGETVYNIKVWAYQGGSNSDLISTQVRLDGTEPNIPPSAINGWIPRDNEWHQVAQTRSASGINKYYIDGQLVYTSQGTINPAGASPLLIGASRPPLEVPSTVNIVDGIATVGWNAVAGSRYMVTYKNNVADPDWYIFENPNQRNVPQVVIAAGLTASFIDEAYESPRVYRVTKLDDLAFKGGLDKVMIYNLMFSDADVTTQYHEQRDQFRKIDDLFVDAGIFNNLPEPERSLARDDLEALSKKYASAWRYSPIVARSSRAEMNSFMAQKFDQQVKFFIDQLRLYEKYDLSYPGHTADQMIAMYAPIWEEQRVSNFADDGNQANPPPPPPDNPPSPPSDGPSDDQGEPAECLVAGPWPMPFVEVSDAWPGPEFPVPPEVKNETGPLYSYTFSEDWFTYPEPLTPHGDLLIGTSIVTNKFYPWSLPSTHLREGSFGLEKVIHQEGIKYQEGVSVNITAENGILRGYETMERLTNTVAPYSVERLFKKAPVTFVDGLLGCVKLNEYRPTVNSGDLSKIIGSEIMSVGPEDVLATFTERIGLGGVFDVFGSISAVTLADSGYTTNADGSEEGRYDSLTSTPNFGQRLGDVAKYLIPFKRHPLFPGGSFSWEPEVDWKRLKMENIEAGLELKLNKSGNTTLQLKYKHDFDSKNKSDVDGCLFKLNCDF